MSRDRPAAAFFDFDRTVIEGDAGVSFGWELLRIRRGRARDKARGTVGWAMRNLALETGTANLLAQIAVLRAGQLLGVVKRSEAIKKAYLMLKGLAVDDLRILARDYFDEVLAHRLYGEARDEMHRQKEEGRRIVVVSTGLHIVVDPVRDYLPVDDVIACELLAERGISSGRVRGPLWGKEKATAVRKFAHEHGLSLPRSWAYTDHYSDLRFLQLVGHPVAVNADLRLRLHARHHKWPVRKWTRVGLDSKGLSRPRRSHAQR